MATRYIPQTDCSGIKTYKTEENAVKAVENWMKPEEHPELRYIIMQDKNGRYVPVFIGQNALQLGVHFTFHVIA